MIKANGYGKVLEDQCSNSAVTRSCSPVEPIIHT